MSICERSSVSVGVICARICVRKRVRACSCVFIFTCLYKYTVLREKQGNVGCSFQHYISLYMWH